MDPLHAFSQTYQQARDTFRSVASNFGARLERHAVNIEGWRDGDLAVDVAIFGANKPSWSFVASSGIHGVEGFFGSAVQIKFMEQIISEQLSNLRGRIVLIHAINPFGFAALRRVNEENIDLNRNFLLIDEAYKGAPEGYHKLNDFLNPTTPPSVLDMYTSNALWKIFRLGLPALRQAVAGGQYEYSNGLFFGGKEPAQSTKIVQNNFLKWSSASHIVHIDLHSDLGKYGRYKMLLTGETDNSKKEIYNHFFGSDHIELAEQGGTTAYKVTGDMGRWIAESTKEIDYHFLAAEFGTYSSVRVLGALRAENRAHFYAQEGSQIGRHAKSALLECFCPEDPSWRTSVVEQGVAILQQGQRLAHQLASGQT